MKRGKRAIAGGRWVGVGSRWMLTALLEYTCCVVVLLFWAGWFCGP
jgi:hypothetical protein